MESEDHRKKSPGFYQSNIPTWKLVKLLTMIGFYDDVLLKGNGLLYFVYIFGL